MNQFFESLEKIFARRKQVLPTHWGDPLRLTSHLSVVRRLSLSRVWARLRPAPPHPSADQATDARRQQEKKQLANHAQVFGLFNARYDNFISCEWGQVPFLLLPSS